MSIRTNLTENQHIRFSFLSDGQKGLIFNEVLRILQHTGVEVKHEQACSLLAETGCRVRGRRVYMPSHVVNKSLSTLPLVSTIYKRKTTSPRFLPRPAPAAGLCRPPMPPTSP